MRLFHIDRRTDMRGVTEAYRDQLTQLEANVLANPNAETVYVHRRSGARRALNVVVIAQSTSTYSQC